MSIASYRRNVERRVTGPQFSTCFPAALEQISPHHSYRPRVYREYQDFIEWFCSYPIAKRPALNPDFADMVDELVRPLGNLSCEDVVFKRANCPVGMQRIVKQLLRDNYRTVVDLNYATGGRHITHAVGLLPSGEENYVTLVSTHVPKPLQGLVSLQEVAAKLAYPDERYYEAKYPFSNANITALPPLV